MEWLSDIFTMQFAAALASIIVIDLVLAGDNAILIALAARNLPPELQKKAIMWGAAGAIVVRALMTLAVVWLLKIPGLMLVGGLALVEAVGQIAGQFEVLFLVFADGDIVGLVEQDVGRH